MLRQIWLDIRRGPALLVGLLVAAACTALLLADSPEWTGRWVAMTVWLRGELNWAMSITAGFAVWMGGRHRRRNLAEFIEATPKPRWRIAVRECAGISICAMIGYLVAFAVGAILVGRISTYDNTHWIPILLVGTASVIPACALGYAVGTRISWFLAAPATIGVVAVVLTLPKDAGPRWALFDTMVTGWWDRAGYLQWRAHLGQAVLLAGLTIGFLIIAASRRWWLSAAPVAAGVVAALLLFGSHPGRLWRPDPVARQAVCSNGATKFCTFRENGYALNAAVPTLRRALAPIAEFPGVPRRFDDFGLIGGRSTFYLDAFDGLNLTGRLSNPYITRENFLGSLKLPCQKEDAANSVFWAWLTGEDYYLQGEPAAATHALDRLHGLPKAQQRARVEKFLAARRHCDSGAGKILL